MKLLKYALVGALALGGCAETPAETAAAGSAILEEEFGTRVLGRNLVNDDGNVVYNADGTFKGTSRGEVLVGRWEFQNGRYCVVGSVGGNAFPAECQRVVLENDRITFDGRNFDITYTIES